MLKKIAASVLVLVGVVSWSSAFLLVTSSSGFEPTEKAVAMAPVSLSAPALTQPKVTAWAPRSSAPVALAPKAAKLSELLSQAASPKPQVLGAQTYNVNNLNSDQALDMDKPGVVGIINWLKGSISVPDFDIDLKTFALTPRPDLTGHTIDSEWSAYGSGFVVNTDGFIATNAHVVAQDMASDQMREDILAHWKDVLDLQISQLSSQQKADIQDYLDKTYGTENTDSTDKMAAVMTAEIDKYIKANMTGILTQNIVVIDKSLKGETLDAGQEIQEIYSRGLPANIVDFDPNYRDTQKDVALIKLGEKNLPALPLGSSDGLASGAKAQIFGFPYNAHMDSSDWFEPTLTQGVVGAIKDINGQKVIQLDNKISHGSSGGPLLDEHGNVLGLVTYLTGSTDQGDDFGFALPVELVKDMMAKHQISNDLGVYGTNLLLGFYNKDNSYCKTALDNFAAAGEVNSHFPVADMLAKPIADCQVLITTKMSKDSAWDIMRIYYQQHVANALIFTTLAFIVLVLLGFLAWLGIKHWTHKKDSGQGLPPLPVPG